MANEFIVKNGLITPSQQFTGATSGSTVIVSHTVASGTLTLPPATDTLVGKATTDTFTNKTINLANNTLTATSAQILAAVADETGSGSLVFATSPTLVTPILGTPQSATLTNATGLPISTGVSGLATGAATFLATPSSANLAALLTDETGSGANVFGTSPAITTSLTTPSTSFDLINTTATTVNFAGAGTAVTIGATTGTTTVRNGLVVTGNLTVNGTTTTVNATTITVDDINIELGSVATPTDVTANGGGITLKGATDKTISWSSVGWTSSEDWNLVTGKVYEINGTSVLSATTLGSGVTGSSLTSVGTITSGTWSASFGAVSGANLTSLTAGNLTGTIPSAVLGNSTHYIGTTAVALNRASANQAMTGILSTAYAGSTSGTTTLIPSAAAGTTTITMPATTGTMVTTGDTGTVTSTMIADGTIVNDDINASAAIAVSKLAASTISGVTLGGNLSTLTMGVSGTGLSGSTTYNGSGAATFTVASNATSANTASTIVARNASGNFTAGTITAALSGNATTATTATQVANALTLSVSGTGLSGSASFTGASAQTFTVTSNATSANTASTIVARDASGNFTAGTITAALSGNATTSSSSPILSSLGNYVWTSATPPTTYSLGITNSFVSATEGFQSYGSVMTMKSYSGGGGSLQLYTPYSPSYGGTGLQVRFGNYDAGDVWTSWKVLLASDNYNSYAPTLTGTGASGTWGISITGNAATITNQANSATITATTASTGNTIVQRDASGYIQNSYFNTSSGGAERNASGMGYFAGFNSSDYYIRSYTPAAVATAISGQSMNIAGNATTATNLSGFTNSNASNPIAGPDSINNNGIGYVQSISLLGQTDGALYSQAYSSAWQHQIYGDYRTGQIAVRGENSGTWQPWRTVLDSSNWSSYVTSLPSQTGNSGKYLKTDGTNASWQPGGLTIARAFFLRG